MLVYRVEHRTVKFDRNNQVGAGPYGEAWGTAKPDNWWDEMCNPHPDPYSDGITDFTGRHVCCFVSRAASLDWFHHTGINACMRACDFVLVCYELEESSVLRGQKQAMFDTSKPFKRLWSSRTWERGARRKPAPVAPARTLRESAKPLPIGFWAQQSCARQWTAIYVDQA